jgi:beta-N-acetylhexosaminidase
LRKKLGFEGVIITDSLDMRAISRTYSVPEAARRALNAGADILLIGGGDADKVVKHIAAAVAAGTVKAARVEDAFRRVVKLKNAYRAGADPAFYSTQTAYAGLADFMARRAVTLIKDKKGFIPVKGGSTVPKKVGFVMFAPQRFWPDILEMKVALTQAAGLEVDGYFASEKPSAADEKMALERVGSSQITVLGSFQWNGVAEERQKKLISKIIALGKPVILVSLMSPYDTINYPEADAMLAVYGITRSSMEAAAAVILGRIAAQGIMPVELFPAD